VGAGLVMRPESSTWLVLFKRLCGDSRKPSRLSMLCDEVGRLLPPRLCSSCLAILDQRPLLIDCWNILSTSSCLLVFVPTVLSNWLAPRTDTDPARLAVSEAWLLLSSSLCCLLFLVSRPCRASRLRRHTSLQSFPYRCESTLARNSSA
jgi:hypothetical protein